MILIDGVIVAAHGVNGKTRALGGCVIKRYVNDALCG